LDVAATGEDDPELDLPLTWVKFELGARRYGIFTLTVGRLDRVKQYVGLWEKDNRIDLQPCSLELIDFLLAFAKDRDGDRCDLATHRSIRTLQSFATSIAGH
jgi:hypothetical protein